MLSIFTSIIETIGTLIMFVVNSITSLIQLIINIPTFVTLIFNSINVLPAFLIPFIMAYISLVVVQYILNRKA